MIPRGTIASSALGLSGRCNSARSPPSDRHNVDFLPPLLRQRSPGWPLYVVYDPVPLRETVCGLFDALSFIVTVPLNEPAEVG
jgi:hypothetical protein